MTLDPLAHSHRTTVPSSPVMRTGDDRTMGEKVKDALPGTNFSTTHNTHSSTGAGLGHGTHSTTTGAGATGLGHGTHDDRTLTEKAQDAMSGNNTHSTHLMTGAGACLGHGNTYQSVCLPSFFVSWLYQLTTCRSFSPSRCSTTGAGLTGDSHQCALFSPSQLSFS